MTVFILLTLILGLGKLQHAMELLPIIGTVASTWALFRCKGLTVRCVMWCSTACWVTHNLWLGSIGGTLIEGSFLIVNGLNIIRFRRMQKRGIDPFKVENAVQEESPSRPIAEGKGVIRAGRFSPAGRLPPCRPRR
ncbi:inner membrane protein ygjV [Klebsiella pneumoniae]|uniref:Inner membrane protein ygjV n=1 Tax=Klebsiella pneumoniae TaxID=573 RepID=A0A3S4HSY2_KLEPN|nr:inner membrane protein ygjV [Klebsiella pneumoniae]